MFDYNSISFEARERARSRERDGEHERIARRTRAHRSQGRRSILTAALQQLHIERSRLAGEN